MGAIQKAAIISLVFIFFVIIAGSIVRMTGSGMGCPDWPKCFGYIIPPTEEAQVLWQPDKTYHKGQMIVKDEAMWSARLDFTSGQSFNIEHWEKYTRHAYATFNPTHTWIEYINRLFGAASGVPVLVLFVLALLNIKKFPIIFLLSAVTLFMLGYEAWLGKLVVDGNLVPHAITKHMFGSMAIVALLLTIISKTSQRKRIDVSKSFKVMVGVLFLLLTSQILLGTQVREQIDEIAKLGAERSTWIGLLDVKILIHRSFSLVLIAGVFWIFWINWKNDYNMHSAYSLLVITLIEIVAGIILYYFDVPKFAQPIHLLLGIIMFSYLFWMFIRTSTRKA